MKTRPSARVVLADRDDRILLIRIVDDGMLQVPDDPPAPPTYWIAPGGGAEPDETLVETARREVFEETGIADFHLGDELYVRETVFVLRGERLLAVEHFFAGWVDDAGVSLEHLDPLERGVIVEHRWWTRDEIADPGRSATIFPANIAELVKATIAGR